MHYSYVVIGDDWESQLEPFDENMEVEEYCEGPVSDEEVEKFMRWIDKESMGEHLTFDIAYQKHGKSWNSSQWRKDEQGVIHSFSSYNQKSRWDWYALGGRWTGMLKTKEGDTDQAEKKDVINLQTLSPYGIIYKGKCYEHETWDRISKKWNIMSATDWKELLLKIFNELPDDTLLTVVDLHI